MLIFAGKDLESATAFLMCDSYIGLSLRSLLKHNLHIELKSFIEIFVFSSIFLNKSFRNKGRGFLTKIIYVCTYTAYPELYIYTFASSKKVNCAGAQKNAMKCLFSISSNHFRKNTRNSGAHVGLLSVLY